MYNSCVLGGWLTKTSNKSSLIRYLCLLIAAIIWGLAFVAQSQGMDYIQPFTFTAIRSLFGAVVLVPVFLISDTVKKKKGISLQGGTVGKFGKYTLLVGGLLCGIIIFLASNLQQFGIKYSTVGKSGFITTLYIVLVPIVGLFFKKRSHWTVWLSVAVAVLGLYFICINDSFTIATGDLLLIGCAVMYTFHILVIDVFTNAVDGVKMSCIQFVINTILSSICAIIFERDAFSWQAVGQCILPLLYSGIGSCGIAFTLQIIGQKNTNPTIASLLMSLESCFSVLGGCLILHQTLTSREWIGCALMFTAVILTQVGGIICDKITRLIKERKAKNQPEQ